jgi:hypothetical protein
MDFSSVVRVLQSAARAAVSASSFERPTDGCLLDGECVCSYLTWVQLRPRVRHILQLMTVHRICFISTELQIHQVRQYSINMTLRRVRVRETIVALENQEVLHFLSLWCSLSYPERKAHAPYYFVICGLCGCAIFFYIIS